ncbi:hypothetical protein PTQ27_08885 [Mannheimia sp. AT1]|uniref:Lipoprotein n=1 Tax=Mannheimia cairinae TaxID=3025936 RepID=A0ABT5MUN0_9PAST|nr:hypothetical protein [Mannheimia cairinae]MDD0824573.1 hypothetical protein [Mannheimia cairinae]MDD0825674.1 hypothetical protein [Mannheimia cairinae]
MNRLKLMLLGMFVLGLTACNSQSTKIAKPTQVGYLKDNISQAELNNRLNYKRYSYYCHNFATGEASYLATYFPLWKESRLKDNFGFYFQLNGGKAQPFDHLENKALNMAATRFEVLYRSYYLIEGSYVDLKARERSSVYYKNNLPWLECREG